MKRIIGILVAMVMLFTFLTGCEKQNASNETTAKKTTKTTTKKTTEAKKDEPLIFAWYPNESGEETKEAREEIGKIIEKATGREVKHQTTTDYVIVVEAIANANVHFAFVGGEGYVQSRKRSENVEPLVVYSGKSGTLDDAVYYSWLNVKKGNEDMYKVGDKYKIDNIQGKRFSFVSNSSTSGFKVPSAGITSYFKKNFDEWKNLTQEDLLQGGKNEFFSEVLYGGSHQNSAVNVLTGKSDVSAFCDVCVQNYVELASGTENRPGAVYRVIKDAAEPFDKLAGQEFVPISVTAVLNAPFVYNKSVIDEKTAMLIRDALTSDEVTNNPKIFVPKDSEFLGFFKKSGDTRFVPVDDAWYNPIRELSE
jgi:phosphonate transport system substrate-binding protein